MVPPREKVVGSSREFCEEHLPEGSVYRLLATEGHRLFPDELFEDLFANIGRWSVPPRIVAVVMALQRIEGLSDRDAVERFTFDARWKYAAGGLEFDYPGFVHTVLVDMRARLRASKRPDRIFEVVLDVAKAAGLVGRKRVFDSTALYDAVATQDTVTLIRSAIRALLRVAGQDLARELRAVLKRDDDYAAAGKPTCDWDDAVAREALVDALARDAFAVLAVLNERKLEGEVASASRLVATVVGQDLEQREDGVFAIARRVAKDRIISTVDPEARHGHKTAARGFDGYKGHVAIDPDSEIITATDVTPGNVADGAAADKLVNEALAGASKADEKPVEVYGDSSYGTADLIARIETAGVEPNVKVQAPSAHDGLYTKDDFVVNLDAGAVTCPAGRLVQIRTTKDGGGLAAFGVSCMTCPQRDKCSTSKEGRNVRIHPCEATLQRARRRQKSDEWRQRYRATRPKVERKIAHLMCRRHGGRRARVRGVVRIRQDFALLGAAINLKRLAVIGVHHNGATWAR